MTLVGPVCHYCRTPLQEYWNGTQQIMMCPEPHNREQRRRYALRGFLSVGTNLIHRMFDRCRYDGPSTEWEDEVTCDRCRGWQHETLATKTDKKARIEVNLNARLRRTAVVCAVDGGKNTFGDQVLCGKPLSRVRQRVAIKGPSGGAFDLVTCPRCWAKRPKYIIEAEASLVNPKTPM